MGAPPDNEIRFDDPAQWKLERIAVKKYESAIEKALEETSRSYDNWVLTLSGGAMLLILSRDPEEHSLSFATKAILSACLFGFTGALVLALLVKAGTWLSHRRAQAIVYEEMGHGLNDATQRIGKRLEDSTWWEKRIDGANKAAFICFVVALLLGVSAGLARLWCADGVPCRQCPPTSTARLSPP